MISVIASQYQAAAMDAMYWNSTLRHYPVPTSGNYLPYDGAEELYSVHNSGLIALSLESNEISDSAVELLGRALRKNQWILGPAVLAVLDII